VLATTLLLAWKTPSHETPRKGRPDHEQAGP